MQCPGCGRPIQFEEKYSKVIACPYCNSILEFGSGELTKVGEQGDFIVFPSQFQVGKTTTFDGKNIYVKGQLRFEYDGGFFDEFFVEVDGKLFFIREDDGMITFLEETNFEKKNISLIDKVPGTNFLFENKNLYIEEVGIFKLVNIKGYVNTKLLPGREYEYLVGISGSETYFFEKDTTKEEIRIQKLMSF